MAVLSELQSLGSVAPVSVHVDSGRFFTVALVFEDAAGAALPGSTGVRTLEVSYNLAARKPDNTDEILSFTRMAVPASAVVSDLAVLHFDSVTFVSELIFTPSVPTDPAGAAGWRIWVASEGG